MLASFDEDDPFWRQWREYERLRRQLEEIEKWTAQDRFAGTYETLRRQETLWDLHSRFESEFRRMQREAAALERESDMAGLSRLYNQNRVALDRAQAILKETERFGRGSWATFSESAFRQAVEAQRATEQLRRALSPWEGLFGASVLADVATSLGEWPPGREEFDISAVVANAVASALEKHDKRVDYRWLWALIISILAILVQLIPSGSDPAQIVALEEIQANVNATRLAVELLNTRLVLRRAIMRLRPISNSMVVRTIPAGSAVVLLERHKKWSRVRLLRQDGEAGRRAELGWILNKYLARAP